MCMSLGIKTYDSESRGQEEAGSTLVLSGIDILQTVRYLICNIAV